MTEGSDGIGSAFVDAARRELQLTPWNYATIQKLIPADRKVLADVLREAQPYLSLAFLELVRHADAATLARCFADEVRRHQREQMNSGGGD